MTDGRTSPIGAVGAAYARLAEYGDPATFISLKTEEDALREARALEAVGPAGKPLYGLIFSVKDNIDVRGLPTTAACPAFKYEPGRSAFVVGRLEEAVQDLTAEADDLERRFAKRLNDVARKVEAIATAIDETGAANTGG